MTVEKVTRCYDVAIPVANDLPSFASRIQVDQTVPGQGIAVMLLMGMLGALPGFVVSLMSDMEANGWWALLHTFGLLGGALLSMVGMIAGMLLWSVLELKWKARRGRLPFSALAEVIVDARGVNVDGLGHSLWGEVLAWEAIPDCDYSLIVHTQRYGALLLKTSAAELIPVLEHYLAASIASEELAASERSGIRFRAQMFSWRSFLCWIVAGYVAAIGVAALLIVAGPDGRPLKTMLALVVLIPISAWLFWSIAFWRLSLFGSRHVRVFELRGKNLCMGDGSWQADLATAVVRHRLESGIGYKLSFLTVRPPVGKRLDLLLEFPEHTELLDYLRTLNIPIVEASESTPAVVREYPEIDIRRRY